MTLWRSIGRRWVRTAGVILVGTLLFAASGQVLISIAEKGASMESELGHSHGGMLGSSHGGSPAIEMYSDWIIGVGVTESRSNDTIVLKGNLTVQGGGILFLDNVTLVMNSTVDGEFSIAVEPGGTLHVKSSTITAFDRTTPIVHEQNPVQKYTVYGLRYHFVLNGTASIVGSTVEYLWGEDLWSHPGPPGGLEIYSSDVLIDRSEIRDAASYGLRILGASPTITRSTITRSVACSVVIHSSGTMFENNVVELDMTIDHVEHCGLSAGLGNSQIIGNIIEGSVHIGSVWFYTDNLAYGNMISGQVYVYGGRFVNNAITVGPSVALGGQVGITFVRDPLIKDNTITYIGPLDAPGPTGILSSAWNLGGVIINNTIYGSFYGLNPQQMSYALYEGNRVVNTNMSVFCMSGSTAEFKGNIFENSEWGFYGIACHSSAIENNTFIDSRKLDFYLESTGTVTSHLVATNNSFDPDKVVIADSTSSLLVENYLHARVLDKNLRPLPGAQVGIDTMGRPLQQRLTGWEGESMWFRVPYVNYTWDNYDKRLQTGNPFKRLPFQTTAFATYMVKDFNNLPDYPSPRSVNMSTSHWEYFIEVGAPDLVELYMQDVQATPDPSLIGTPVSVSATVRNWGLLNATSVQVEFREGGLGGTPIGSTVLPLIERLGGRSVASLQWTPPATGNYTVCAIADPGNLIPEVDESDNGACTDISVVALPDLAVSSLDLSFTPSPPFVDGSTVLIDATVRNLGVAGSPATTARFYDGIPPSQAIDGDTPVGPVPAGGSDVVQVQWTANRTGQHDICVVVDPNDLVAETDETNNIACVPVEVVSLPDLTIASIGITPPSPVLERTVVRVDVDVSNQGDLDAMAFDVLVFDDVNVDGQPDPGEDIATDALPSLTGHSQTNISVLWTAIPPGSRRICAYADPPPGAVSESNEMNNVMCVDVVVQPGPVLRPDYLPVSPLPLPPVKVGMSSPVQLSIQVLNQGNGTTMSDATVTFYEPSSPSFFTSVLSPLAPAMASSRFTATWTSPATPGTYTVSVDVDYYDNVTEWDETNNVHTWTIDVVSGPVTSLVIGLPKYTSTATYIRSTTSLDLTVLDQSGLGIRNTTYSIDGGGWENYTATGTFFLTGEGAHSIKWRSLDWAGNLEDIVVTTLIVDDTPPTTTLSIGDPKYTVGGNFVTSSTLITLQAVDGGAMPVGVETTRYQIDGNGWSDYSSPFTLAGEGTHLVEYYSRDLLTNEETAVPVQITVDDAPPATTISPAAGGFNLTTTFTLAATDNGSGVRATRYRIDGGTPTDYSTGFTLTEGDHNVSFFSIDNLDNTEEEKWLVVTIQGPPQPNTPPTVTLTSPVGGEEFLKGSVHTITWTMQDDEDADANLTVYVNYTSGGNTVSMVAAVKGIESFLWTLPDIEATDVVVNVTVIDSGGLRGWDESGPFTIKAPPPPPEVEANYKPVVAVIFVIILLVAGLWSSRRRPWKGGKDRMAVAKAFAVFSLPFVVLEIATGILSMSFEPLRIPPAIGWGTGVDVLILVGGLAFQSLRLLKRRNELPNQ